MDILSRWNILEMHLIAHLRYFCLCICKRFRGALHRLIASASVQYPENIFRHCHWKKRGIISCPYLPLRNVAVFAQSIPLWKWEDAEYFMLKGYILAYLSSHGQFVHASTEHTVTFRHTFSDIVINVSSSELKAGWYRLLRMLVVVSSEQFAATFVRETAAILSEGCSAKRIATIACLSLVSFVCSHGGTLGIITWIC